MDISVYASLIYTYMCMQIGLPHEFRPPLSSDLTGFDANIEENTHVLLRTGDKELEFSETADEALSERASVTMAKALNRSV